MVSQMRTALVRMHGAMALHGMGALDNQHVLLSAPPSAMPSACLTPCRRTRAAKIMDPITTSLVATDTQGQAVLLSHHLCVGQGV